MNILSGSVQLEGKLEIPENPIGIVLFAHGSGSSRHSSRNRYVADVLRESKIATLLFDLLTAKEEEIDIHTRHLRFDINLLADRLLDATNWVIKYSKHMRGIDNTSDKKGSLTANIGYFGASTGAAAALVACSKFLLTNNTSGATVKSIVSRGGRPDLAGGSVLLTIESPTL